MRCVFVCVALIPVLSACASTPEPANPCADIRPLVCTMEYAPTCAVLIGGGRKEFTSPCTACASDEVSGYDTGPCPE